MSNTQILKNEIEQIERKNEENKRRIEYEKEKSYMNHLRDMDNIKKEATNDNDNL